MGYKVYRCESCWSEIWVDESIKEKPIACPKCRGMLVQDRVDGEPQGEKYDCPNCENSFYGKEPPFKCAFCDHTFRKDYSYF